MEGIEQNPVVYDLMSEMAFRHTKLDVKVMLMPPFIRVEKYRNMTATHFSHFPFFYVHALVIPACVGNNGREEHVL